MLDCKNEFKMAGKLMCVYSGMSRRNRVFKSEQVGR